MAVYRKRAPRGKNKKQNEGQNVNHSNEDSTTEAVFTTLDEGASKIETWVQAKQKYIVGAVGAILAIVLLYFGYTSYILEPKEVEGSKDIYYSIQDFKKATQSTVASQRDSLFNVVLEGDGQKYGLLEIMNNYSGTDAANQASYFAGITYYHLGQYKKSIEYLESFDTDEPILKSQAIGFIGDCFSQLTQYEDALSYYQKAFKVSDNSLTTPRFLMKAAMVGLQLGKTELSNEYFARIKNEFPDSNEGKEVDALLAMQSTH